MQYPTNLAKTILAALPPYLDFYGMGIVRQDATLPALEIRKKVGIAYDLYSERENFRALFVIVYDDHLDYHAYSELGNVMAGRLATSLGSVFMISPPSRLQGSALERVARLAKGMNGTVKQFNHHHGEDTFVLQTVLILHPQDGPEV